MTVTSELKGLSKRLLTLAIKLQRSDYPEHVKEDAKKQLAKASAAIIDARTTLAR